MEKHNFKIVKLVDSLNLEHATRAGWVLIEVLAQQEVRQVQRYKETPAGPYGSNTYVESIIVDTHMFLVGLDEASTVAELNEQVAQLSEVNRRASIAVAEQNKRCEALEKAAAESKKQYDALTEGAEISRTTNKELVALKNKLEEDIAKIRVAIGAKAMKEILG